MTKATFVKIPATGAWGILVPPGTTPKMGDEFRVRKADKSITTVFVKAVMAKHSGGTVCSFTERKTESLYSLKHLVSEIRPGDVPIDPKRAARASRAAEEREYDPFAD